MDTILIQYYQSPCGELILGSFGDKLCMCDWVDEKRRGIIDKRMPGSRSRLLRVRRFRSVHSGIRGG